MIRRLAHLWVKFRTPLSMNYNLFKHNEQHLPVHPASQQISDQSFAERVEVWFWNIGITSDIQLALM